MTSRTLKLLTASTAFIAAASVSQAQTISTASMATQYTSTSLGGITVTGTGSIVPPVSGTAIEVSNTNATHNNITIQQGGRITNNYGGSATIVSINADNAAVTITNNGILSDGAGSGAIDLSNMSTNNTITNSGTISGSVVLGSGTNTFTSTGTTTDYIGAGSGSINTLNFNNANHTNGQLNLFASTSSTVNIVSSTINGDITGSSGGSNTIVISNNSTVNGEVDLGQADSSLTVSSSRVNGDIVSSKTSFGGQTHITLTNAIVSGTIFDDTTNDNDTLTINGTRAFTTGGIIQGMEHVSVQADTTLNHNLVGTQTLGIGTGKTLTANTNFNTGGLLTNDGTLFIAAGKEVGAQSYTTTGGGTLGIGINSSDTTVGAGKLNLTNGALAAGTSVTISMGENVGYLTSGTQYVIATGDGVTAAGVAKVLTPNTGVYRYSTLASNSTVTLNVERVTADSIATNDNNTAVGKTIESLATSSNTEVIKLHSVVGAQSNQQGVNNVLESLTPGIDGAGAASVNITHETANQVNYRLASLRNGQTGVATGDPMSSKHMWIEGFGSTLTQDDTKDGKGYDATTGGISAGIDTDTLINGVTTGIALTYGQSKIDSNASNNATTDVSSYIATFYGSRVFDNGFFLNGQVGGGYNEYDMERTVIGMGTAKGTTNGIQGTAKFETGRDFPLDNLIITPLLGVQYTYLKLDSYTETGPASLQVSPDAMSMIDTSAGLQASYAIPLYSGATLKPSVHARYVYRLGDDYLATSSRFNTGGAAFTTNGAKSDKDSINVGAGLLLNTVYGTDFSLNYDADIRSSFIAHSGKLKARIPF